MFKGMVETYINKLGKNPSPHCTDIDLNFNFLNFHLFKTGAYLHDDSSQCIVG